MNWKGGIIKRRGYVLIKLPNHPFANSRGYYGYHRWVYEQFYNCILLPWVEIHHINGIRDDNRIENLQPISKYNHRSLHFKKDMSNRFCLLCKKTKTNSNIIKGKRYFNWYKYRDGFICKICYNGLLLQGVI